MAQGIPTDPLLSSQWHLGLGAWAINVQDVWLDYTGNGVTVAVLDDGFDYLHPDLSGPYNTSLDYDYGNFDTDAFYVTSQDTHGTAVMGIIGADDNGQGGVGVAFDTELIGYRLDFSSFTLTTLASALNNAANNADIMNNSWGFTQIFSDNFSNSVWSGVSSALINMVDNGRGGLGTITLFSGGNDRAIGGNSNYHNMSNSPYTIAVAALDQDGTIATTIGSSGNPFEYSSPGANLLVSAPGSQIQTTDVRGATGYSSGDYTNVFGGTSAASPIVSGVVALMLEANPNLGYRDVQEILAFSARKNDPTSAGWQTNGAGLSFNHDYGFGLVDATAAVRMAETWTIQQTFDNRISVSQTQIVPVIINDLSTSSSTITYNSDYEIEHVLIDVNLSHSFIGDLVIRLISPDNTVSVLMDRPSLGLYTGSALDFEFSSTAHWGESTLGTWRLEIEDQAAGDTGFLIDWKINFIGNAQTADDLYVFTDDRLPSVINDTDGGVDTLNLSAVTSVVNVDLGNTSGHLIGAQAFSFGATTTIENLITGDANDIIEGSSADNILRGGRGNDRLIYTYADNLSATDSYDGDKGDDILQINFTASEFAGSILDDLRNFLDFIGLNADPNELNGTMYAFTSMNLTVSDIENLEVFVDGILTAVPPVVPVAPLLFIATAPAENFTGDILSDTVNFANSTDGVTVNLQNNTATGGFAQGDTLTSIENLTGTDFADRLTGNADNNTLRGGDDRDVLIGRDGNDKLVGGEGDDTIFGDAGDDELIGNQGFNNFYGGQGNDIFTGWGGFANARYDNDPNPVNINFATGIFEDGWGTFDTFFGIDRVFGSDFGDILMGGTSRIRLVGGLGDDTINGGSNLDILFGNEGMDTINGNGSKDEIFGGDDDDDIFGGDGPDKLFGDDGDDEIFGENGFDRLIGGLGFDTLDGGADKDRASYETSPNGINVDLLNGTADDGFGTQDTLINIEFIVGSDHNDTITGDNSNNLLSGGLGIDTIDGGLGDDTIEGEEGNDILFGYAGFDRLIGGAGNDTIDTTGNISARVSYETSTSGINVDLAGGSAQDGLGGVDTLIGVRRLEGSAESDTINGSDDRDFLYGMDEIDFIFGGLGNDIIEGGEGNDRLNGNGGFDQLTGDAGEDGFIFDADALIGTPDAVQDFDVTKDYLEIDSILSGYTSGVTPIEDFVMITDDGTDSFVMVDTDGGADSFTQIATLKNVTGLTDEAALISSGALVIV